MCHFFIISLSEAKKQKGIRLSLLLNRKEAKLPEIFARELGLLI